MRRLIGSLAVVVLLCVFASSAACGQEPKAQPGNCTVKDVSTRPDCPQAMAFFSRFQNALKAGDRGVVAAMVSYPLRVTSGKAPRMIRGRAMLMAQFDRVFDRGTTCAVLRANVDQVWGNYQGFMVADGAVWFDAVAPRGGKPDAKYPFKIITVNGAPAGSLCSQ